MFSPKMIRRVPATLLQLQGMQTLNSIVQHRSFSFVRSRSKILCPKDESPRNFTRQRSLVSSQNKSSATESKNGVTDEELPELNVSVPWGCIRGKIWGSRGSDLPVLAVHGWQDNAGTFDKLIPLLNSSHVVAMELPGHGQSSHLPPGDVYTYADFVVAVRRVIRHLKWTKFNMIGHSMGAGISALYSSVYSSEVQNLILLDLPKPISRDKLVLGTELPKAIDATLDFEPKLNRASPVYSSANALERLLEGTKHGLTQDSAKILMKRGTTKVSDGYKFTRDPRLQNLGINRFSHQDIFELYSRLKCRVMFAKAKDWPHYERQEIIDKALDIFRKQCPEFQHVVVDGKHFFHLDQPEEVSGLINEFFSKGEVNADTI